MRWECRYSPCEMMYLEVKAHDVVLYLHHSPHRGDQYSFEQVLEGAMDAEVRSLFGDQTLTELKAELKRRKA